MRWGWEPLEVGAEKSKLSLQTDANKKSEHVSTDIHLDGAHRLLSYILKASTDGEEIILPSVAFYGVTGRNYKVSRSIVANWLETVDQVQKERAELKELTAKVEGILESEYGIKPKVKKSAK